MISKLSNKIQSLIDWEIILTKKGNTQNAERYYIDIISKSIEELGGKIEKTAGSQQAIDFQKVLFGDKEFAFEAKKANTGEKFIFNDTVIKSHVYYIFFYCKIQKVMIVLGEEILKELRVTKDDDKDVLDEIIYICSDMKRNGKDLKKITSLFLNVLEFMKSSVCENIISLFDYGQIIKQTITLGNASSRPRPNWSFKVPYKSPVQEEEEPHFQSELSVLCDSLKVCTVSETPESVLVQ